MREAVIAAPVYLHMHDRSKVSAVIENENLLHARTIASGHRLTREVVQRLAVLTDAEIEVLIDATSSERANLLWVAACRCYDLIGEFAEEVLRERFLLLAAPLSYEDFDSFLRGKSLWHEELAELKESTVRRLRSNVFRMLRDAGLLSDCGDILQAVLSQRVAAVLAARAPSDLRFFPTTDSAVGSAGRCRT